MIGSSNLRASVFRLDIGSGSRQWRAITDTFEGSPSCLSLTAGPTLHSAILSAPDQEVGVSVSAQPRTRALNSTLSQKEDIGFLHVANWYARELFVSHIESNGSSVFRSFPGRCRFKVESMLRMTGVDRIHRGACEDFLSIRSVDSDFCTSLRNWEADGRVSSTNAPSQSESDYEDYDDPLRRVFQELIESNAASVPSTLRRLYNAHNPDFVVLIEALADLLEEDPTDERATIFFEDGLQDTLIDIACEQCSF